MPSPDAASIPSRIADGVCAVGVLSIVFWPVAIFALGIWFVLWVARLALLAIVLVWVVVERVVRS